MGTSLATEADWTMTVACPGQSLALGTSEEHTFDLAEPAWLATGCY